MGSCQILQKVGVFIQNLFLWYMVLQLFSGLLVWFSGYFFIPELMFPFFFFWWILFLGGQESGDLLLNSYSTFLSMNCWLKIKFLLTSYDIFCSPSPLFFYVKTTIFKMLSKIFYATWHTCLHLRFIVGRSFTCISLFWHLIWFWVSDFRLKDL